VFVPAGIGTDYGSEWAGRYYATSSSLVFVNMQPVIAYQASDWLSLAAGASIMYVDSVAESAFNNLQPGLADGRVKLEVDGLDAGAIVAAMLEPWEGTRFAISYRSEQTPDLEGRAHFRNLGPLLEAALGSAGLLGAKIDLGVNVPQAIQAGFYHEFDGGLSVMGDVHGFGQRADRPAEQPPGRTLARQDRISLFRGLPGQPRVGNEANRASGAIFRQRDRALNGFERRRILSWQCARPLASYSPAS
jgi:hypothetical protein